MAKESQSSKWGLLGGPFATIAIFPYLLPYLVLIGIELGNVSTYLLLRTFNRISNQEQLIVGLVSISRYTYRVWSSLGFTCG
jgi:hypothetical protein